MRDGQLSRRGKLEMYADVARACVGGTRKTAAMYKCSITFKKIKIILKDLGDWNIITCDNDNIYNITKRGNRFLLKYDAFKTVSPF